jgi:hypothetical protein
MLSTYPRFPRLCNCEVEVGPLAFAGNGRVGDFRVAHSGCREVETSEYANVNLGKSEKFGQFAA